MPNFRSHPPEDRKPLDPEAMTLEMLARRVRLLMEYSLTGYLDQLAESERALDVESIVEEVVDQVRQREKASRPYAAKRSNKSNLDFPIRSFLANVLTHQKLDLYKMVLLGRHRDELDSETLTIWFIQRLLSKTVDHHCYYVAMAMLKILFLYDHVSFATVTSVLQLFSSREAPSEDQIRRWKKKSIDDLATWFGDFVEVIDEQVGHHPEKHFRRPPAPQTNLDLTIQCLGIESLPRESCVLLPEIAVKSRGDILRLLQKLTASMSPDAVERILMHLLTCPIALFPTLKALEINSFGDRLGIPGFRVTRGGSPGSVSLQRREIIKEHQTHKTDILKRLEQRDDRRGRLTLDRLLIAVDGVVRQRLSADDPQTIILNLQYGQRIIEVRGEDDQGTLPLDLHYVSWDPDLEDKTYTFVTDLKGGRQVKFLVTYERDTFGDLTEASLTVNYNPSPRRRYLVPAAAGVAAMALIAALYLYDPSDSPISRTWIFASAFAVIFSIVLLKMGKDQIWYGVAALIFSLIAILFPIPFRWLPPQAPPIGEAHFTNVTSFLRMATSGIDPYPKHAKPLQPSDVEPKDVKKKPTSIEKADIGQPSTVIRQGTDEVLPPSNKPSVENHEPPRKVAPSGSDGTQVSSKHVDALKIGPERHGNVLSTIADSSIPSKTTAQNSGDQAPLPAIAFDGGTHKSKVTLAQDQIIRVRLAKRLSSETAREGDLFATHVVETVLVDGEVVVPQETRAFARVSKVRSGRNDGDRDSIEVQLVMLELNNQTARIEGELLSDCRGSNSPITTAAIAPKRRPKVAFVGDDKKGAVIAPVPKPAGAIPIIKVGSGFVDSSIQLSNRIRAVVEPGRAPATNVCFALKKSVSLVPPRVK